MSPLNLYQAKGQIRREHRNKVRTPYFPGNIKPVHVGWYEVEPQGEYDEVSTVRYWDGQTWRVAVHPTQPAPRSASQDWKWRGLAKRPIEG